jgi:hypothetical protein
MRRSKSGKNFQLEDELNLSNSDTESKYSSDEERVTPRSKLSKMVAAMRRGKQDQHKRESSTTGISVSLEHFTLERYQQRLDNIKTMNMPRVEKLVAESDKIRSKLAQFYIIDAYLNLEQEAKTKPEMHRITLDQITDRWLDEMNVTLGGINKHIRTNKSMSKYDKAIYFVTHCLHFLIFGHITSKKKTDADEVMAGLRCPQNPNAPQVWNFIHRLMFNEPCLCYCYATYIRAAAVEFGYGDYVYMCNGRNSSSIVIVDPSKELRYIVTQDDLFSLVLTNNSRYLRTKSGLQIGEHFSFPKITTLVNISFNERFFMNIETETEQKTFISKYMSDIPSLTTKVETIKEIVTGCEKSLIRSDLVTLLNRIVSKRVPTNMITQLLYVGRIFTTRTVIDGVEHVFDMNMIVDNLILLFLIYSEKELEYEKNKVGKTSHREYHGIKNYLDILALTPLDTIYDHLEENKVDPLTMKAILSVADQLLAKHKNYAKGGERGSLSSGAKSPRGSVVEIL